MASNFNEIKEYFSKDLENYNLRFAELLSSDVKIIDTVIKFIVKHKGKTLRPLIVIMSARLLGEVNINTYSIASIIEFLHTASLIHDDVVDDAHLRRGFPSINAIWKNKIAVLIGDYLLSKSLISATETGKLEVMNILAHTSRRLTQGELFQIEKSKKLDIAESDYFRLISDKTAALISASSELGAMSVTDNAAHIKHLKEFGEHLGIAFQIKDDLLDYQSTSSILGKPAGNDLKEKKITLPLIFALSNSSEKEIKQIKNYLRKKIDVSAIREIIRFTEEKGGIQYAEQKQNEYVMKAKAAIEVFPDSKPKQLMYQLVEYVVERKK
jgi:octaprenyl-diphosphate synthase